jgi:hypothetical protein
MAFNPLTAFCGEEPGFPRWKSSPAGGVRLQRELLVLTNDLANWLYFFTAQAPIDPYLTATNLWEFGARSFEKQERIQYDTSLAGPAVAYYQYSILELTYESEGMRFFPGQGIVKEEHHEAMFQEPVGIARLGAGADPGAAVNHSINWSDGEALFYAEHPHFETPGSKIVLTFPFAPTSNEPFPYGTVNDNAFTMPCSEITYPRGTLMFAGFAEKSTSVVIPALGFFTGLTRTRKAMVFHYRNPANEASAVVDWNTRWRSRDQQWMTMKDQTGSPYHQFPYQNYDLTSWFI